MNIVIISPEHYQAKSGHAVEIKGPNRIRVIGGQRSDQDVVLSRARKKKLIQTDVSTAITVTYGAPSSPFAQPIPSEAAAASD